AQRLEQERGVNPDSALVMRDRVVSILLEGGDLHLGAVGWPEHLPGLPPSGPQLEASRRQHLDLFDARDVPCTVLDVGEQLEDSCDWSRYLTANGDCRHMSAP